MSSTSQSFTRPASPTKQNDGLFLLEVLVDKVIFTKAPCFADKDFRTCVAIECPAVPTFVICDDDPDVTIARSATAFTKSFNSGKSCLFSLKESDISNAMSKFPVKVEVYKTLQCGCIPTKVLLGKATIDMTKEFIESRKKFLEDPTSISYQALKDAFQLVGADGEKTGDITMFLRISCFGKLIVTKFQSVGGPPTLGTGMKDGVVDRSCNPKKVVQSPSDPCACGSSWGHGGRPGDNLGPCPRCGGNAVCPTAVDPYNSWPCAEPDDPCYCCGAIPKTKEKMLCRNTDQYCLHVPKDCCPPGNKVVFQMPAAMCDATGTGHKQRTHFNMVDGIGEMSREEPGKLISPSSEDYKGVVFDFDLSRVIRMRIGKTVEMAGHTSKLEYVFMTPGVGTEVKGSNVPTRESRPAQWTPECGATCRCREVPIKKLTYRKTRQ